MGKRAKWDDAPKKRSRSKKHLDRLDRVCLEINKYNKEHGTNYSYGEYTALIRIGKIHHKREV